MKQRYYKLSEYARNHSITYQSAWNRYNAGKIAGAFLDETGHVLIPLFVEDKSLNRVAIYSRVSSNEAKKDLERQKQRLESYAINFGYNIVYSVKEVGSGMNDSRSKLSKLLMQDDWDVLIVENKDRLTRFGFNYIELLLNKYGKKIVVVNQTNDDKTDIMNDLISIIYSFSARMYGLRKRKNKQEIIDFIES